ncbi:tRNA (adenosine(37)-N6)-dimethylallyltransferase MiaA [Nitratireductor thuwali]|uniref:tRNA dimethylallyltransferase n=1 Tax=Nitratireductor thuwali TaxID=2267699 RepID=A0ABY5MGT6_9HYPH|nr:tRNA dimethylallyltransferase [Nitratireductor thuwali]
MSVATRDMGASIRAGQAALLKNAFLIAGPTASGKSGYALNLAQQTGGVIINADSMQVYSVLSVITARPQAEELAAAPHRLYGHVHPSAPYSTGAWLRDVADLVRSGDLAGKPAIFVGGTGLYFRALTQGLAPMPDIPDPVRKAWRKRLEMEGAETLHRLLAERDPQSASRIEPGDGQRIVRALEVLESSGEPIGAWQARKGQPLVDLASAQLTVLEPDRKVLHGRIAFRFDQMIRRGALQEVRALLSLGLSPAMPSMKAIGVRELGSYLAGEQQLSVAVEQAIAATRQYAKRQSTWFRHQLDERWKRVRI